MYWSTRLNQRLQKRPLAREGRFHLFSTNDFFKDGRLEVSPSTYKCFGPPRSQPTTSLRTVVLKNHRPPTSVPVHHLPLIPHLPDFNQGRLEVSPSTYKCTGPPITPHTPPSRSQPTTSLRTVVLKNLRPPTSVPVHLLPLIPHLPDLNQRLL